VASKAGERSSAIHTVGGAKKTADAVLLDQRQQVFGDRLAGDHVAGANVDRRAEEDVELRAVVQRQRVQHQVTAVDAGVDDAADVLPEHRVVVSIAPLGSDSVPLV
jgi:hypothetical protein